MDLLINKEYDLEFKDGDFVSTTTKFPDYELLQQFVVALTCEKSSYVFDSDLGVFIENLKGCESLAQVNNYLTRALRSLLSDQIYFFKVSSFRKEKNQMILNLDITTNNDTYSLTVGV